MLPTNFQALVSRQDLVFSISQESQGEKRLDLPPGPRMPCSGGLARGSDDMPVPEAMMVHLLRSATIAQGLGLDHIFTKKARLPTVRPRSGATCCDARRQPGTCLVDRYLTCQ